MKRELNKEEQKVPYRGGSQGLAKGTKVKTARGLIPIEDVKVGDKVYSETSEEVAVLEVVSSGPREVADVQLLYTTSVGKNCDTTLFSCPVDHKFLTAWGRTCKAKSLRGVTCIKQVAVDYEPVFRQPLFWGANKRVEETFDIRVDSPTNFYQLEHGFVTSNSGK